MLPSVCCYSVTGCLQSTLRRERRGREGTGARRERTPPVSPCVFGLAFPLLSHVLLSTHLKPKTMSSCHDVISSHCSGRTKLGHKAWSFGSTPSCPLPSLPLVWRRHQLLLSDVFGFHSALLLPPYNLYRMPVPPIVALLGHPSKKGRMLFLFQEWVAGWASVVVD